MESIWTAKSAALITIEKQMYNNNKNQSDLSGTDAQRRYAYG